MSIYEKDKEFIKKQISQGFVHGLNLPIRFTNLEKNKQELKDFIYEIFSDEIVTVEVTPRDIEIITIRLHDMNGELSDIEVMFSVDKKGEMIITIIGVDFTSFNSSTMLRFKNSSTFFYFLQELKVGDKPTMR